MDNTVTTALTSGLDVIKTDAIGAILIAVPAVLAIIGLMIALKIGIKFFRGAVKA